MCAWKLIGHRQTNSQRPLQSFHSFVRSLNILVKNYFDFRGGSDCVRSPEWWFISYLARLAFPFYPSEHNSELSFGRRSAKHNNCARLCARVYACICVCPSIGVGSPNACSVHIILHSRECLSFSFLLGLSTYGTVYYH